MMTKRMAIAAMGAAAMLFRPGRANAIFGGGLGNSVNDTMDRNGIARDRDGDGFNDRGLSEGGGGYADDAERGHTRDFRGYRDRFSPYTPKEPHLRDYEYPASQGGGRGGGHQGGFGGNVGSNQAGGPGQNPSNY